MTLKFNEILEEIQRINKLEGKTIPEKFIKFNEEFGEFSAEVVKFLGMSHKHYDREHLKEEIVDQLQVNLSLILQICELSGISFDEILDKFPEKNEKWESKISEYTKLNTI